MKKRGFERLSDRRDLKSNPDSNFGNAQPRYFVMGKPDDWGLG
jgi:hypothetical protein